jgi:hypothetical protein
MLTLQSRKVQEIHEKAKAHDSQAKRQAKRHGSQGYIVEATRRFLHELTRAAIEPMPIWFIRLIITLPALTPRPKMSFLEIVTEP